MEKFELSEIYEHVPEVKQHIEWLRHQADWNLKMYKACTERCLAELTDPLLETSYFTQEIVMYNFYKNYEQMTEEAEYFESRLRDLSFRK